jgi:putative flippase GtrA
MGAGMRAMRYIACALVAGGVNVALQALVFRVVVHGSALPAAIVVGTGGGLLVKYVLDKRYVFDDPLGSPLHEARRFGLYTATGVLTTLVFLTVETAAYLAVGTREAALAGAVVGLGIGYALKFALDSRFVFREDAR